MTLLNAITGAQEAAGIGMGDYGLRYWKAAAARRARAREEGRSLALDTPDHGH